MNRRLQTNLPTHHSILQPKAVDPELVQNSIKDSRLHQKSYYERSTKFRKPLNLRDSVRMKRGKDWIPAVVTGTAVTHVPTL